jgi:hypothetical protein
LVREPEDPSKQNAHHGRPTRVDYRLAPANEPASLLGGGATASAEKKKPGARAGLLASEGYID